MSLAKKHADIPVRDDKFISRRLQFGLVGVSNVDDHGDSLENKNDLLLSRLFPVQNEKNRYISYSPVVRATTLISIVLTHV